MRSLPASTLNAPLGKSLDRLAMLLENLRSSPDSLPKLVEELDQHFDQYPEQALPLAWPVADCIYERLIQTSAQREASIATRIPKWLDRGSKSSAALPRDHALSRRIRWLGLVLGGTFKNDPKVLEQHVLERPTDGMLQLEWGKWLLRQDQDAQHRGIDLFRRIGTGSKAGSPIWLEARLRTAQGLQLTDQPENALELVSFLETAYPKLDPAWKKRLALLKNPATSR
jgi:hypothetical protein